MSARKRHAIAAVTVALMQGIALAFSGGWTGPLLSVLACAISMVVTGFVIFVILEDSRTRRRHDAAARASQRPEVGARGRSATELELRRALYNIRNLLAVSVDLNAVRDLDELCRSLALHFLGLMRVTRVAIFLPQESGDVHMSRRYGRGVLTEELHAIAFDLTRPEVRSLADSDHPILLHGTTPFEEQLLNAGFRLLAPLRHAKQLEGVLLIGPRIGGANFQDWEIQLCSLLANMASVAIANMRIYEELERSAITDALTGLYNRRHFDHRLAREVALARRLGHELSLVMVDVDHFKRYNDTYGHPAGDALLRTIAEVMRGISRETDVWARYGGEEFAAILPGVGRDGSRAFAERVRLAVRSLEIPSTAGRLVTVSLGAASFPADATLVSELLVRADRALYAAKERGRDRVVLFSEIN